MATYAEWVNKGEKLEAERRWADAAALWERMRDFDRAINAHKRAGQGERAAMLLQFGGRLKEAAAMYQSVGQYTQAAGVYEKLYDYDSAARSYLRANHREQAALMWEKGGAFVDAAKVFYALGNHAKAVQLYERGGDAAKAQELKAKHGLSDEQTDELAAAREVAVQKLLSGEGAYADERQVVGAILYLLKRDRLQDAAKLYSHCREDIGYPVMTAVTGHRDIEARLAKMFYAAKDFYKTAQVVENLEQFDKAAVLYERSDAFEQAAEMYAKVENAEKAAEMYERAGKFPEAAGLFLRADIKDRAAVNFERCQEYFQAGKLFYELRKGTKSLQLLQQVQKTEPRFLEATAMVGAILVAGGYQDLAVKKYQEALVERELDETTAPVQYRMARLLEDLGRAAEARGVYEALAGWQMSFEDVQVRLDGLQGKSDTAAAPVAAAEPQSEGHVVTMMDGFEFLKETALFNELSLEETKAVYHAASLTTFQPGHVLIEQDQPGAALYVLRSGEVSVRKVGDGKETELARLGAGAPLGEMSLFDDSPTSARVVVESPSEAFAISRDEFDKLLAGSDRLALRIYSAFVKTLTGRLRETSARAS